MNWIKQNTFLFGLATITVVGAILLWLLGSGAANRYEEAKEQYDEALAAASRYEKLDLYPNADNLKDKKMALEEFSTEVEELQKAFDLYRPEELENITVQTFASAVKQANKETRNAFGKDVELPEAYFCGFESYRTALPPGNATGILNHQLDVTKQLMLNLAEAGPTALISVHRPKLPEEEGKKFEVAAGEVTRELPIEIVFEGPESAVRQFLSSVVNDQEHYLVVRSLRIVNEKLLPPRSSDAKFSDRPRAGGGGGAGGNEAPDFSALFDPEGQAPGEAAQPLEAPPEEAPAVPFPAPAPLTNDSSRILYQVLGQEKLQVFVRIDHLLFLEPKELP